MNRKLLFLLIITFILSLTSCVLPTPTPGTKVNLNTPVVSLTDDIVK